MILISFVFSILQLLQLFAIVVYSQQRCYYDVGKLAPENIIPCYPSTFSDQYSCCKVGNKCLRHNACYDDATGVTYQYGCTDPTFQDEHCPKKCSLSTDKSHWVGLVFCNGQRTMPNNTWVCHHPDNCGSGGDCAEGDWGSELEPLEYVTCKDLKHEGRYVAFTESWTISDLVPLPVATELSTWWEAHADRKKTTTTSPHISATTLPGLMSPNASGIVPSETAATTTPTSSPTSASPALPNRRAVAIGLGAGIGFGVPVLLALAALTFFHIRRQRKKHLAALPYASNLYSSEKGDAAGTYPYSGAETVSPVLRFELEGSPVSAPCASPQPSELQDMSVDRTLCVSPEIAQEMGRKEGMGRRGEDEEEPRVLRVHELPF